ncbi:hypothetical protein GPECTOR_27g715 [Gonium pectorale]|uniref:Uncharacterized protein n=1 Tax=Gonium pectorale TaxID=33097 RepID=A0A150GFD9_GONPE|nr:hypothetical protein GPECTOR_27g715 [Gonium pectorale]|eukprot:KXZ48544.1 hypothetical protein GPECTOR_27g715 [Gonium pectorale]
MNRMDMHTVIYVIHYSPLLPRPKTLLYDTVRTDRCTHDTQLLNLVEGLIKTRRERRYMWFAIIAMFLLGAVLIGAIVGLTYAVVAALKDTEIHDGTLFVKGSTTEVVRTGSAEFSVLNGVMVSRESVLAARNGTNSTASPSDAPPANAVLQTASFLGTPVKFSSRVDIRTLMELKYLLIKGAGEIELGVMVTGVARVPQAGSVYGTVLHIITAAGTITLDGTAITFDSEVADIFAKAGFTVARNRRALLGIYDVLGFFNLIKDLSVMNLPDDQPRPALPTGDFLMKLKVYELCVVPSTPEGDRCLYHFPEDPATEDDSGLMLNPPPSIPGDVDDGRLPAPSAPPPADDSRRSLLLGGSSAFGSDLPRRGLRHVHVRTAPHRSLADGGGDFATDLAGVEVVNGVRYMTHNETAVSWKGSLRTVFDYAIYPSWQKIDLQHAGSDVMYTWQQPTLGEGSPNIPVPYYCRNSTKPPQQAAGGGDVKDRVLSFTYEGVDTLDDGGSLARHFKLVMKQFGTSSNITIDYWDTLTGNMPIAFKFEHPQFGAGRIRVLEFKPITESSPEIADAKSWETNVYIPKLTSPFSVNGEVAPSEEWIQAAQRRRALEYYTPERLEEAHRRAEQWATLDHVGFTGEWPEWAVDMYGGVHPAYQLARSGRALMEHENRNCSQASLSVRIPFLVCTAEIQIVGGAAGGYLAGSLGCSGTVFGVLAISGKLEGNMCEKKVKGCMTLGLGLGKGNWLVTQMGIDGIDILSICVGGDWEAMEFFAEATLTLWFLVVKAEATAGLKWHAAGDDPRVDRVKVEGFWGVDYFFGSLWFSFGTYRFDSLTNRYLRGSPAVKAVEADPVILNLNSWISVHEGQGTIGRPAVSFALRIENQQGENDDTALNGLKVNCKNGDQLMVNEGMWGTGWYDGSQKNAASATLAECKDGRYFTGVQVRFEGKQYSNDDTAMNSIRFACGYNNRVGKTDDLGTAYALEVHPGYWGE